MDLGIMNTPAGHDNLGMETPSFALGRLGDRSVTAAEGEGRNLDAAFDP